MYTVLARKYRSQRFDDVAGQDPVARTLKNAIKGDRVAHAYLFTGTRGVGKTTMARILAKSLNCLGSDCPTAEPCCQCESCVSVNSGDDIDVIEIDGATNNGVEQVRQLRENAVYRPARSRYKIYIIDEVHMLSSGAFNALLKTLEEPPPHVKFIFATTEPNKVPATIQSRCQKFDFRAIPAARIAAHLEYILKKELISYEADVTGPLARMADGSMRDALSLLDRLISTGVQPLNAGMLTEFLGCPDNDKIFLLTEMIAEGDAAGVLEAVDELATSGLSESRITAALIDFIRDVMLAKCNAGHNQLEMLTADQRRRCESLAEKFDMAAIVYDITTLEALRWRVKNTETARAMLEATLLRLALSEHFINVDQIAGACDRPGGRPLKKNPQPGAEHRTINPGGRRPQDQGGPAGDLAVVRGGWSDLARSAAENLPPATAATLAGAIPFSLEGGELVLRVANRDLCESGGRAEKITRFVKAQFQQVHAIRFENIPGGAPAEGNRTSALDDPAVRTVLMGLDATITGVDNDRQV